MGYIAVLAVSLALVGQTPVPARHDRIAFQKALSMVTESWQDTKGSTRAKVMSLLGPPDDIWKTPDPAAYVTADTEVWCYGSNTHLSFPTLGTVTFKGDTVDRITGANGEPPALSTISDAELAASLRAIAKPRGNGWREQDPLRLIQLANLLRRLGKIKILAVLCEYERLETFLFNNDDLFWVIRALFEPGAPEFFPAPYIGALNPSPPENPSEWPLYPLVIKDDIPFSLYMGRSLFGLPESVAQYIKRCDKGWTVRAFDLRPPDDPFPASIEALKAPETRINPADYDALVRGQVMSLIRNAYEPQGESGSYFDAKNFEKCHQEFLKQGCRWDEGRQIYVRRDGTFRMDELPHWPELMFACDPHPRLHVDVRMVRSSDAQVHLTYDCTTEPGIGTPIPRLFVYDLDSGKRLSTLKLSDGNRGNQSETTSSGSTFDCPQNCRLKLVVECGSRQFDSSVLVP